MGINYYCFHDVDLVDAFGNSWTEYEKNLHTIVDYAKENKQLRE
jgi:D-xylose isomerase (EC 5.3.1.5)